ncbi:uncharacterized protein LOC128679011 isoform X1 [Plodia interpunctella]|uniref:uncharacterized protein LOC128679011 isoform X1 n=1 Tax=Plodia interpunctella TaxID=58824 RepID=UPI002368CA08|nr:uncharacterized protein LOC128679011 isoform X2 [Plodia interpunctella]
MDWSRRRREINLEQLQLLIEFLYQHHDLAFGKVRTKEGRAKAARLWKECERMLNAEGPARTGKQWSKFWNDWKCRLRHKVATLNANRKEPGVGPNIADLSPLEEGMARFLGIMNIGLLTNGTQDPLHTPDGVEEEDEAEEKAIPEEVETDGHMFMLEVHSEEVVAADAVPRTSAIDPSYAGQFPTRTASDTHRADDTHRIKRERKWSRRFRRRTAPVYPSPPQLLDDECRSMLLGIEKTRAEAELRHARASLKQAEAALAQAEATAAMARGFTLLADTIDRFTKQYLARRSQHRNQHPEGT